MLGTEGLGIEIGERWLWRNLDLSLKPGIFLAITGPSGSGKTSLLRALAGETGTREGTISRPPGNQVCMVHQDLQLADGASCLMNALGGCLGRHSFFSTLFSFPAEERAEAIALLREFGLSGKERQWASTLSRGERQRLAICRALLARPRILLADEPVASLDFEWADHALSLLKTRISGEGGCLVCSLHDESQVLRYADLHLHPDPSTQTGWSLKQVNKEEE